MPGVYAASVVGKSGATSKSAALSLTVVNAPPLALTLSAAYIDPEGVILEIHDLQPHNTNSVVAASERVQFVLETNQGWFGRHHVTTGMVVRTERGTLAETFKRQ